jgi:hypothetical protein
VAGSNASTTPLLQQHGADQTEAVAGLIQLGDCCRLIAPFDDGADRWGRADISRFEISSVPTLIEQSQLVGRNGLGHDDRLQRK